MSAQFFTTSHQVSYWKAIPKTKLIELFSPDEWEEFIKEWLEIKSKEYIEIEKVWWANDMWRDVIAYIDKSNWWDYKWDCYQCKHYNAALQPNHIYTEIWKILYYSYKKEYPIPRKYFFIAPKWVGTSLSRLLSNPDKLKQELINIWPKQCKKDITKKEEIDLDILPEFKEYIERFDFSIFSKESANQIISEHEKHSNHLLRFGWWLPPRPKISSIPEWLLENETNYTSKLIEAYKEDSWNNSLKAENLNEPYTQHFKDARICFHHAEQLRNLYRDNLPSWTYEDFQEEIYYWVKWVWGTWFNKVTSVEWEATKVKIESNPLKDVCVVKDKIWVCHQLSNNNKLTWK